MTKKELKKINKEIKKISDAGEEIEFFSENGWVVERKKGEANSDVQNDVVITREIREIGITINIKGNHLSDWLREIFGGLKRKVYIKSAGSGVVLNSSNEIIFEKEGEVEVLEYKVTIYTPLKAFDFSDFKENIKKKVKQKKLKIHIL